MSVQSTTRWLRANPDHWRLLADGQLQDDSSRVGGAWLGSAAFDARTGWDAYCALCHVHVPSGPYESLERAQSGLQTHLARCKSAQK